MGLSFCGQIVARDAVVASAILCVFPAKLNTHNKNNAHVKGL
jgi:hypothetical protein